VLYYGGGKCANFGGTMGADKKSSSFQSGDSAKYNIMLPSVVWQDYDVSLLPFDQQSIQSNIVDEIEQTTYKITATISPSGSVRTTLKTYSKLSFLPSCALLIVPEYNKMPSMELIMDFAKNGFFVAVADIAGNDNPPTEFSQEYAYGKFSDAGEHISSVMPTARETSQYLYTLIIKRSLYFMRNHLTDACICLVGLGDAVEVAMQAAGSGAVADGLVCINGAGYREYIKLNKFGSTKELDMTDDRICWLSGVASVAYAKSITIPTFVAIGTNAEKSDIDRINNLVALLPSENIRVSFSPNAADFILPEQFATLKQWIIAALNGDSFPENPQLSVKINSDGKIYAEVNCDTNYTILRVQIHYSYGEYNHIIRDWRKSYGIAVSEKQYIATIEVTNTKAPLFAFAEVEYLDENANKIVLSSLEEYVELQGQSVKTALLQKVSPIVYATISGKRGLIETCDNEILMQYGLKSITTKSGANGITSSTGGFRTYHLNIPPSEFEDCLLQIEFFSTATVCIVLTLFCNDNDAIKRYSTELTISETNGVFNSIQFKLNDFKDMRYKPLTAWGNVRALEIRNKEVNDAVENITVGNMLFI
jgi:hypothetical protein